MVGIHPLHRRLAEVAYMSTEKNGEMKLSPLVVERIIIPLLKQNLELIQELDGLKQLALEVQILGDMRWVQEICQKIEKVETILR